MADSKISALPASTVPLAGTEVLPIVQSSTTKQVSVANLTAGRAISATQITLTTGSVIVASGQGVDFSATPGTGTSELFADYEEGTWTPTVEFGGASVGVTYAATRQGTYTKIGRAVTVQCQVVLTSKGSSTGAMSVSGLPYTPQANSTAATVWIDTSAATIVAPVTSLIFGSNPAVNFFFVSAGSQSNYTNTQAQDTSNIVITATYFV